MLLKDYGSIIIQGICDSDFPKFLTPHFRRERKKLIEKGYESNEIKDKLEKVISLIRISIENIYAKQKKSFEQFKEEDRIALINYPKGDVHLYNYPEPDISNISITRIEYPSGYKHDLRKRIFLDDVTKVETALCELFNNEIGTKAGVNDSDIILKHLHCLSGFWKGKKIITEDEYNRLIEYAEFTMKNDSIPKKIIPIQKGDSGLPKSFIQHTIYKLWQQLKQDKGHEQKLWVGFLKKVFQNEFKNNLEDYLLKKFCHYNKNYEQDIESITYKKT